MRTTLLSFLEDCARRGDETALAHRQGLRVFRWSYARLRATAFQFSRELEARGIGKSDRVLFWGENSPEWVAAFFGCLLRGAIVVPLDVHSAAGFVRSVAHQVQPKLMLYSAIEPRDLESNLPGLKLEGLDSLVAHHSAAPCPVERIEADDLVEIIFTSGTTAEPKGVCLTHRNVLANIAPLEREIQKYIRWERFVHPIRFLNLVPLSHVFGQFLGIFVPHLLGTEVFFQDSLKPTEIMETIKQHRISVLVAVPRQLETLRDKIERDYQARGEWESFHRKLTAAEHGHFLNRWWMFRAIHRRFGWKFWAFVSGGAALDAETETFWHRLGYAVVQGYGMTETASVISVNHPFRIGRGSIGKTLPGQEVKLAENGEILVRGENVSPGYWSGDVKPLTDHEGWLPTGDVGEMDDAGQLYFKGRKKDVIVTAAGMNIYPEDLEAVVNRQPEVRESCVIEMAGPHGPEPLAVLILRGDRDAAEIIRRANESLAQHQQIRRWFVWPGPDFPRTATTQKVRKRLVAEMVKARLAGERPARDQLSPLAEVIASVSGETSVALNSSATLATDLKLDSLGRVELLSALEDRYQVEIDEAAFTAATTLADIENLISEGGKEPVARYPDTEWAQRFPATWIRLIVYYLIIFPSNCLMCWARVKGREHLGKLRGPVLFISNHVTMTDHGLILWALPMWFRHRLAIAMEGERLRDWYDPPEGGWFKRLRLRVLYALVVTFFNVFPLPQKSGFRRSFAYAGQAVDRGYHILVFPEGRRTQDGHLLPFMAGAGVLAANLRIPVVPIRIDGLFELKQQGKYFSRPGRVTVTIGEPVTYSPEDDPVQITKDMERRVASL